MRRKTRETWKQRAQSSSLREVTSLFKDPKQGPRAGERRTAQRGPEVGEDDGARSAEPAAKLGALALCLEGTEDPVKSFNRGLT